jgi:tetratricopeptide (TPR) repeat protein
VDAELVSLIGSFSAAVASGAGTDAWNGVKGRLGSLFGRSGRRRGDSVLGELEELRGDVAAARDRGDGARSVRAEGALEQLLGSSLRELMAAEPSAVGGLRDLIAEVGDIRGANGAVVVGDRAQVSYIHHNHYYGVAAGQAGSGGSRRRRALPRISLRGLRHYQNHQELLDHMDAVWEERRAQGVQTALYLYGIAGMGAYSTARRWVQRNESDVPGPQLEASLGRDSWGHVPDAAAVQERWFRQLDVPPEDVPAEPEQRLVFLGELLEGRQAVILLRDVTSAAQVRQLMPDTADSVVVITSRKLLASLVGEYDAEPLEVAPLEQDPSCRLLVSVGRLGADADRYAEQVAVLARECAGYPLALQVIGARLALAPGQIAQLVRKVSDPKTRLEAMSLDGGLSVSAALDPGYYGLDADAALLYRCIGLLPATEFELDVVRAMLPDLDIALRHRLLGTLVDANLIEATGDDGYRVQHPVVHAHALACAEADGNAALRELVLDRIVAFYTEFAERSEAALSPRYRHDPMGVYAGYTPTRPVDSGAVIASLERRRTALRNIVRIAYESGRHEHAWRLAQGLHTFYLKCQYHTDWIATRGWACLSALECGDLFALARMRFESGFAHLDRWSIEQEDPELARTALNDALERVRGSEGRGVTEGDRRTESSVLEALGLIARKSGQPGEALRYYDLAEAALAGIDHPRGFALLALHRGTALTDLGRHDEAARQLRSAREKFKNLTSGPDTGNQAKVLTRYAEGRRVIGLLAEGVEALDDAIATLRGQGPDYQTAEILLLRGHLAREQGDRRRAAADWAAARDLFGAANSSRRTLEAEGLLAGLIGGAGEGRSQDGHVE